MKNLIRNELMKLFSRKLTKVLLIFLCAFSIVTALVVDLSTKESADWKADAQETIKVNEGRIGLMQLSPQLKKDAENKVTLAKYRLKHNVPTPKQNVASALIRTSGLIETVIFIVLLSASEIVSREYADGTIKLLLTRPHSRSKILISKYLSIIIFAVLALILSMISAGLTNMALYGFTNIDSVDLFINQSGQIVSESALLQMFKLYGASILTILTYASLAFAISTIIRNSAFAIGISLLTMIVGNSMIEATAKIGFLKYLPFANSDMSLYIYHLQPRPEMTMGFSIVVLLVYILAFLSLSLVVFNKRDVLV